MVNSLAETFVVHNNKFTYILFLAAMLLISCNDNEPTIKNLMNANVNGEDFKVINENVSVNEHCDVLYVNTSYFQKNTIQFRLEFEISTTGQLLKVWYVEYDLPGSGSAGKIFLTPNFNLTSTFKVLNFHYDSETRELQFRFEGTVFWEHNSTEQRDLTGDVKVESLKTFFCDEPKFGISHFSTSLNLFSYYYGLSKDANEHQLHRFVSNNGYILEIHLDEDLWNNSNGVIQFDENSHQNKVSFLKHMGSLEVDQIPLLNENDWINYATKGQIIIEEKLVERGRKIITGKINLNASHEDVLSYSLEGISFRTGSFED